MKPLLVALLLAACTKPNPAVCCLDEADCAEIQAEGVRPCDPGFACVDHACVLPSCASEGCAASAPVCDTLTDVCASCTDAAECARFPATPLCEATSGSCVECVMPADCPVTAPICDANACRVCRADSECASGACGDDGACIAEADVVYMDPGGTDAGSCARSTPCRTLQFAAGVASTQRFHIVLAPGLYTGVTYVAPSTTSAPQLYVHGHGADLEGPMNGEDPALWLELQTTVRDIKVSSHTGGPAIQVSGQSFVLEDVLVRKGDGVVVSSSTTLIDFVYEGGSRAILLSTGASLTLEGGVIKGGGTGILAPGSATVSISNLLVYGTSGLALDLPAVEGTVVASTIADCGADAGTGPRAVACTAALTIRSSIIWTPGTGTRVPVSGCNLASTIAGPVAVPGASNSDPRFVDSTLGDYHLKPDSPARDAVDTGPQLDFEGDARPQGARFDIGADEASP